MPLYFISKVQSPGSKSEDLDPGPQVSRGLAIASPEPLVRRKNYGRLEESFAETDAGELQKIKTKGGTGYTVFIIMLGLISFSLQAIIPGITGWPAAFYGLTAFLGSVSANVATDRLQTHLRNRRDKASPNKGGFALSA